MTWQPTDEEVRAFRRATRNVPLSVDDCWCEVLAAAYEMSPGPAAEARVAELEALLRETRMYALGSDCSTRALMERVDAALREVKP